MFPLSPYGSCICTAEPIEVNIIPVLIHLKVQQNQYWFLSAVTPPQYSNWQHGIKPKSGVLEFKKFKCLTLTLCVWSPNNNFQDLKCILL